MSKTSDEKQTPLDKVIAYFSSEKHKNQYLTSEGIVYLAKKLKSYYD